MSHTDQLDNKFASVFNLAPLYLAISSLETGAFLEVNDAFEKLTGYSRAEAVGRTSLELGLWVNPQARAAGLEQLKQTGVIRNYEVKLRSKSGTEFTCIISAEVTELDGERCILNAAVDISDRVRANDQLALSRQQLEQQTRQFNEVVSVLNDFVYILDPEARFLFANQALLETLNVSLDEILGRTFTEIPSYPDDLARRLYAQVKQVVSTGLEVKDETFYASSTGISGYYEYTFQPVFAADGSVETVAGSTRNVSRRKLDQLALEEARTFTQQALTASNIAVWTLDLQSNTVKMDERGQTLFGVIPDLSLVNGLKKIHPEDKTRVEAQLKAALDPAGKGKFESEFRQLTPARQYRWFAVLSITTFDDTADGKKAIRLHGTVQDIHERKTTELALDALTLELEARVEHRTREVRELAAQLTLSEQTERQMLAKALHDNVQQELIAVQFALARMRKDLDGRKVSEKLSHAEGLVKNVVKLTRNVTSDLKPRTLDELDLCKTLNWLIDTMKERFDLTVTLTGKERCDVKNEAVRALIYNLTRELLFNIVKHADTKEAGVDLQVNATMLELRVEDKGSGFTPDFNASTPSGTGLGLTGAHKRLQLFGGSLDIKSKPSQGTRITIQLPKASLERA